MGSGFPSVVPPGCGLLARDRTSSLAAPGAGRGGGSLGVAGESEGNCRPSAPRRAGAAGELPPGGVRGVAEAICPQGEPFRGGGAAPSGAGKGS